MRKEILFVVDSDTRRYGDDDTYVYINVTTMVMHCCSIQALKDKAKKGYIIIGMDLSTGKEVIPFSPFLAYLQLGIQLLLPNPEIISQEMVKLVCLNETPQGFSITFHLTKNLLEKGIPNEITEHYIKLFKVSADLMSDGSIPPMISRFL